MTHSRIPLFDMEWSLHTSFSEATRLNIKQLQIMSGKIWDIGRSEGFPNEIFHPCTLWDRALARWKNCRRVAVVAVGVIWKFRSTFRSGHTIWSFPMVLGSWWEIFGNGDRGSTQNFDARLVSIVVWPGEPFFEKNIVKHTIMHFEVHIWHSSKKYGHRGPIIGFRFTDYGHWGPYMDFLAKDMGIEVQ